ncbi:hypothetical protein MKS88_001249 [Plasmodium brasilianum]|uniref:Uncharacterized protein n=1 Tax=Plasmodium brasilianum TaxID=5824 RepID=A0ACB9YDT9_PLABR|nr:hypothetical protein MKS88_001249 [Plasmodium brasilianum]
MEKKFRAPFYIKISTFIFLTWVYNIKDNVSYLNRCFDEKHHVDGKLDIRTYRILTKSKKKKGSNIVWVKGDYPTIEEYRKLYPANHEKVTKKTKNKQPYECPLNNKGNYEHARKIKSSLHLGKDSYCEKRRIDKIYFKNKVRDFKISDFNHLRNKIELKKIMFYVTCILFIPVVILVNVGLFGSESSEGCNEVLSCLANNDFRFSFLILTFIVIVVVIYILKKILKYDKFISIKEKLNNTFFPSLY